MKKNGFTLVEILTVIVLLSLLFALAIPGIGLISNNIKKRTLNEKVNLIKEAAVYWGQNNNSLLNSISNCEVGEDKPYSCYEISVKELYEEDYLNDDQNNGKIVNPVTNEDFLSDESCKVNVYKKNNRVYAYFGNDTCDLSDDIVETCKSTFSNVLSKRIIEYAKAAKNNKLCDNSENRTIYSPTPLTKPAVEVSEKNERTLSITEDDYGSSYYFRGNVIDNYLNFSNKCFRIVRIEGDGSIKLVLVDNQNMCENSVNKLNSKNNSIGYTYYGFKRGAINNYMFDYVNFDYVNNVPPGSESIPLYSAKGARIVIQEWIQNLDQTKLKDEEWCLGNQTDWYDKTGQPSTNYSDGVYSETYKRLYGLGGIEKYATLKCDGEHDEKVSDKGGLLTADEVALAGYNNSKPGDYTYLYSIFNGWLANPSYRTTINDYVFFILSGKYEGIAGTINSATNIIPSIVLKSGITVSKGDGTKSNPYQIN